MKSAPTAVVAPLLAVSIVAALATSLLAHEWRTAIAGPELVLLGSGSRLSVLIRTGEARLLIAAGDDIDAFDRAYGRVQRPTAPRLDLLIIAGADRQRLVPERLVARDVARQLLTLRPIGADVRGGALASAEIPVIRQRRDIHLDGNVIVSVNPTPDHRDPDAWTITVSHNATTVLIVPSVDALQPALHSHPVSSTVVLGKMSFNRLPPLTSRSIVIHGDQAEAAVQVSTDDPSAPSGPWIWIVHDSDTLTVSFGDGELRIPSRGSRRLMDAGATLAGGLDAPAAQERPFPPRTGRSGNGSSVWS